MSFYVIVRHGDVIDGPFSKVAARDRAIELNELFQTNEYQVEPWRVGR